MKSAGSNPASDSLVVLDYNVQDESYYDCAVTTYTAGYFAPEYIDEANMNVLDAEFARAEAGAFERDKKHGRRVTLEEWRRRSLWEKLAERFAAVFGPQL